MKSLSLVKSFFFAWGVLRSSCVLTYTHTHILVHRMSVELKGHILLDLYLLPARPLEKQSEDQEARLGDTTHQPVDLPGVHDCIPRALHQKQGMKTRGLLSGTLGGLQDPCWHCSSTLGSSYLSQSKTNSQQTKWLLLSFICLYSSKSPSKRDIKIK